MVTQESTKSTPTVFNKDAQRMPDPCANRQWSRVSKMPYCTQIERRFQRRTSWCVPSIWNRQVYRHHHGPTLFCACMTWFWNRTMPTNWQWAMGSMPIEKNPIRHHAQRGILAPNLDYGFLIAISIREKRLWCLYMYVAETLRMENAYENGRNGPLLLQSQLVGWCGVGTNRGHLSLCEYNPAAARQIRKPQVFRCHAPFLLHLHLGVAETCIIIEAFIIVKYHDSRRNIKAAGNSWVNICLL